MLALYYLLCSHSSDKHCLPPLRAQVLIYDLEAAFFLPQYRGLFASAPWLRRDLEQEESRVLPIKRVLAGSGNVCLHQGQGFCAGHNFPPHFVKHFRSVMFTAYGVPEPPPVQPNQELRNVLILQREGAKIQRSARMFLHLDTAVQELKQQSDFIVSVASLDGMTLRQQMALFSNASIVLAYHGSSEANIIWLPQGARLLSFTLKHSTL